MSDAYHEKALRHRRAHLQLGQDLATELSAIPGQQAWTATPRGEEESVHCNIWIDLDRADGLKLTLSWYRDNRPRVSPVVQQLPGPNRERIDIEASFDPARPAAALAKDVLRRVVKPWEAQLPQVHERQSATVSKWEGAERRAMAIARALGSPLREDARELIQNGNDVPISIGDFSTGFDVDVKVSNYNARATFKIDLEGDQEFALELAALLRKRMLERIERNGQVLCPGCQARPADSNGFCSGCYHQQRRARAFLAEEVEA